MVQVKKCKCANSAPPSPECRKVSKQMTKDLKDLDSGGKDKDGNWEEEDKDAEEEEEEDNDADNDFANAYAKLEADRLHEGCKKVS